MVWRTQRAHAPYPWRLELVHFLFAMIVMWTMAAGDRVLQHFAALAGRTLRTSDLLARWGGEEFLVLFPDTPLDEARIALERLHAGLAYAPLDVLDGRCVTFSAGLTT